MEAPTPETVARLLLKCEQGIHREGWDAQPLICALVWNPGSALTFYDTGIPVHARTPEALVSALGQGALSGPEFGEAVQHELGENFFGWVHVWSGYYPADYAELPVEQWTTTTGQPPESAIEVRLIVVVDLLGRPYTLRRVRGKKPEVFHLDSPIRPFNKIHLGLANMVLGVVRHMPWAADYQFDLEEDAIPRLTDLISVGHPTG